MFGCLLYQDSGVKRTHFNERNLLFSITNLFGTGTDTTAATMRWALLLMAKYPHIQDKERDGAEMMCSCQYLIGQI